ncbi:MAG TPA: hypothetical protein VF377_10435 [Acidimicrobiia bacterium]
MSNETIAAIRTLMQSAIGAAVGAFAGWLLSLGIEIPQEAFEALVTALGLIGAAVVTFVLNKLQQRWPWIGKILSLGASSSTPFYR